MRIRSIFSLIVLAVACPIILWFSAFSSKNSKTAYHQEPAQNTRELAPKGEPESFSSEDFLTQFSAAQNKKELLDRLRRALQENEDEALLAWAELESELIEQHFYDFVLLFTEHFGERYPPLEAIEKLHVLKESKKNIFINVGLELLDNHKYADKNSAKEYRDFLNDERFSSIASLATARIGIQMTQKEGKDALVFIEQIQDEALKKSVFESAVSNWAINDLEEALDFIASQDPGPQYDTIIQNLGGRIMIRDPYAAMLWAQEINDPAMREDQIIAVAEGWAEINTQTDDYQQWKGTITDESLLGKITEVEERVTYKKEIREIYSDPYHEILDSTRITPSLVDRFVQSISEMEDLVNRDPSNRVLTNEWNHLLTDIQLKRQFGAVRQHPDLASILERNPLPE